MRFNFSTLALIATPCLAAAKATIASKDEFMRAMRSVRVNNEKKERKQRLFSSILSSAKPVDDKKRSLAYYDDKVDDAYGGYGFDLSSYSLKYAGCSAISTFSDDLADDEDATTVFETDQYVVFRFCPSDSCQDSSTYGCLDDYGEYMVPIGTWLELMADYRDEEFNSYCDYCDACGGNYYNNNRKLEDANAGDDAANAGDDDAGDDAADAEYDCSYASECKGYQDVCAQDDDKLDYTMFFECKEFDVSDDLTMYIGPHCAADKSTIVLSAFQDEYCSQYEGNKYDLATMTGLTINTDSLLEYYNTDCISCKEGDLQFNNNDGNDGDEVTEVCENLYNYAAKCNKHIGGASSSSYQSYQQENNEYAVCSFIASVVTGTYDEYGYIYVDPLSFEADNKYNEYTVNAIRKGVVTLDQVFGLCFFVLAAIGLLVHAAVLHSHIQKRSAFDESTKESLNTGVQRQNSGIMMARSTTVDSGYQAPNADDGGMLA